MGHGRVSLVTAILLFIWVEMKPAPMNMSRSYLESGRLINEPAERVKVPVVPIVRTMMFWAEN